MPLKKIVSHSFEEERTCSTEGEGVIEGEEKAGQELWYGFLGKKPGKAG